MGIGKKGQGEGRIQMEAEEGLGGRNERGRKQKKDGKDVSKSILERGGEEGVFGG